MKKLNLLLSLILICGCQSYRDFTNLKMQHHVGGKDSLFQGRYIRGQINNLPVELLFDTGATISALHANKLGEGDSIFDVRKSDKILVQGWHTKSIVKRVYSDSASFNTFSSHLQPILLNQGLSQKVNCGNHKAPHGILGLDAFTGSEYLLHLNYEKQLLEWYPRSIFHNYQPVDAKFTDKGIFLRVRIQDFEDYFLFDTGADVNFLIKNQLNLKPAATFENLYGTFQKNEKFQSNLTYFYLSDARISEIFAPQLIISKVENIEKNIVGYLFIKSFNWIIDFKEERIFAKNINDRYLTSLHSLLIEQSPKVAELDGRLVIVFNNKNDTTFKLGEQIRSINDELVSGDNICRLKVKLNEAKNWDEFKIEFVD